ncbi:Hpt domain-containing protein [Aliiroseovarius sp. KMU-50]|uniref:Hpt domain-containing protein n=1 Tax=Aliiroseovarius salicola TaxID=3009082 RepID=A0ABT4W2J1_9RHOB|nr:Hpt domain-containing protein [Aliiroseovarius sp. KMU-50]MDA5094639.1 Hpt domain-containing protein [Aliiroseovarius sp. KMU-50]
MRSGPDADSLSQFEATISKIRISFLVNLREHRDNLGEMVEGILNNQNVFACLSQVGWIAHKIAGVAATMQLSELGLIAARTEKLVDEAVIDTSGEGLSTELLEAIGALYSQVCDACSKQVAP